MANRKAGTFIKIDRNIVNWQWFKKPNHLLVWMYILLNANFQDGYFQGVEVKRGELAISWKKYGQKHRFVGSDHSNDCSTPNFNRRANKAWIP